VQASTPANGKKAHSKSTLSATAATANAENADSKKNTLAFEKLYNCAIAKSPISYVEKDSKDSVTSACTV